MTPAQERLIERLEALSRTLSNWEAEACLGAATALRLAWEPREEAEEIARRLYRIAINKYSPEAINAIALALDKYGREQAAKVRERAATTAEPMCGEHGQHIAAAIRALEEQAK